MLKGALACLDFTTMRRSRSSPSEAGRDASGAPHAGASDIDIQFSAYVTTAVLNHESWLLSSQRV